MLLSIKNTRTSFLIIFLCGCKNDYEETFMAEDEKPWIIHQKKTKGPRKYWMLLINTV